MSWRRFMALLNGLGPNTATVAHLSAEASKKRGPGRPARPAPDVVINLDDDPQAAREFFAAISQNRRTRKPKGEMSGAQGR